MTSSALKLKTASEVLFVGLNNKIKMLACFRRNLTTYFKKVKL